MRAIAVTAPGGNRPPPEIVTRVVNEIAKRAAKLKKILNRLDKLFGRLSAPRFRLALKLLEAELIGSAPDRAVIAAMLSVPGIAIDLGAGASSAAKETPSSMSLGTEVHEHLQREYRSYCLSPRFVGLRAKPFVRGAVVQDGTVYYHAMLGVPLRNAARSLRDASLYALLFARLPETVVQQFIGNQRMDHVWSMYREDTVDMRCCQVWEIKPLRSAAIGVYQELQYRHAFNLVNAALLDISDLVTSGSARGAVRKRGQFLKGMYFSVQTPLIAGLDTNWIPMKRAFVVGRKQGRPLLAVPLTVPQLPGLLLYVLLQVPTVVLVALSALLARTIADQLEKLVRDCARFVEQVLRALAEAALGALLALAMFVVAVMFWEALAAGGALEALAALARLAARFAPALGTSVMPANLSRSDLTAGTASGGSTPASASLPKALFDLAQREKLKLLAPPSVVGDEVVVQLAPVEQVSGPRVPVIDIAVGHVRVRGLPASARPIVDALAQIGVAIGAGVFAEFLGDRTPQA
jgi:hypothetical protein